MNYEWKVVPLSKGQMKDVRPEDVLNGGHFRHCLTYRGGGGYDKFPEICKRRLGKHYVHQFIVQLRGCNLDCPYCYVTRAGVWGEPVVYQSHKLVSAFRDSGCEVFHLMGGAPALYLPHWGELVDELQDRCPKAVFHSDLMLTETEYQFEWLGALDRFNVLLAVDVKGWTDEEHLANTRKPFLRDRFKRNMERLLESCALFYVTFTNISPQNQAEFWEWMSQIATPLKLYQVQEDSFSIDLIDYDALPFVDEVEWGKMPNVVAS